MIGKDELTKIIEDVVKIKEDRDLNKLKICILPALYSKKPPI